VAESLRITWTNYRIHTVKDDSLPSGSVLAERFRMCKWPPNIVKNSDVSLFG
jgi:hypothetical protein